MHLYLQILHILMSPKCTEVQTEGKLSFVFVALRQVGCSNPADECGEDAGDGFIAS